MSTTGISSWAVDLADIGAVYPFQGAEVIFLLIGLAFWLWWHVWSIKAENARHQEKIANHGSAENIKDALENHH
ncbi:MAG: hypothetical protein J4F49_03535 [Rhodobacteraceae bacterium]|nr:hypothetical protein [Paracoccaceae bacterium]